MADLPGYISDTELYYEETAEVPDDESSLCTCSPSSQPTVDAGGGQGAGASPWIQPFIGQQSVCDGGGLVPTQPDIVFAEQWWGA